MSKKIPRILRLGLLGLAAFYESCDSNRGVPLGALRAPPSAFAEYEECSKNRTLHFVSDYLKEDGGVVNMLCSQGLLSSSISTYAKSLHRKEESQVLFSLVHLSPLPSVVGNIAL